MCVLFFIVWMIILLYNLFAWFSDKSSDSFAASFFGSADLVRSSCISTLLHFSCIMSVIYSMSKSTKAASIAIFWLVQISLQKWIFLVLRYFSVLFCRGRILRCIYSISKVFFSNISFPFWDFWDLAEHVFSPLFCEFSYSSMHMCFICDSHPFYLCSFFVESFLLILLAFVPNFFVQRPIFYFVSRHCFLASFIMIRISFVIHSFSLSSSLWDDLDYF